MVVVLPWQALRDFLAYLDTIGVRSIDMWTSNLSDNDMVRPAGVVPVHPRLPAYRTLLPGAHMRATTA